jgi:hypothetical protein
MANLDLYLGDFDFHHFQTHPFQGNKMKFPRLVTAAIPHNSNGFPVTALVMFVLMAKQTEGYHWPLSTCETVFLKISKNKGVITRIVLACFGYYIGYDWQ